MPGAADRLDLVEEEYRRSIAPGRFEDPGQLALRLAEVHVEDPVDGDVEERRLALAGRGAGEHGLAAAGRSVQQDASTHALAVLAKEVGPLEGDHDLHPDLVLHA